MFFVPLIAVLCAPRVLLCRRAEPLPSARIRDVLRGSRVILAGITLTLAAEWISVFVRDISVQWNGATRLQIGMLVVMSGLDLGGILAVRRAGLPRPGGEPSLRIDPDWLGDLLGFVDTWGRRLGTAGRVALWVEGLADRHLLARIRRHPLWTALAVCAVFGAGVGVNQGQREGYGGPVTVLAVLLLTVGMFGLLVAAGDYLGIVRSSSPWHGPARRVVDAAVITSVGMFVPFALRNGDLGPRDLRHGVRCRDGSAPALRAAARLSATRAPPRIPTRQVEISPPPGRLRPCPRPPAISSPPPVAMSVS